MTRGRGGSGAEVSVLNSHFYDNIYMQSTTVWENNANTLSSRK